MKLPHAILLCLAACVVGILASCSNSGGKGLGAPKMVKDHSIGPWTNDFQGDPQLAGVRVQQFGECPYDQRRFEKKHPCAVWYTFWNGAVRQRGYEPDGTLREDFFLKYRLKPGDTRWKDVDFSYGSDPEFKHHADPRPKRKT